MSSLSESAVDFSDESGGGLVVQLSGDWVMRDHLPSRDDMDRRLESTPGLQRLRFDASRLGRPVEGEGYAAIVAAMSQAVGLLSREISPHLEGGR